MKEACNRNMTWSLGGNRAAVLVIIVLALLVVAVYGRVRNYPYILLDDEALLLRNRALQDGLTFEGIRWAFSSFMDAGWIPLTWISRMADVSIFGWDPGKAHLVNVFLHWLNSCLFFAFLWKGTGRYWESALPAVVFAVHPQHVESVVWITERKDVLAGFFWFLGLLCYLDFVRRPILRRYAFVLSCFILSLLSKPIAVTFPFVLLLLDYWPLCRFPENVRPNGDGDGAVRGERGMWKAWSKLIVEKIPLFFVSAAISAVTFVAQQRIGAVTPLSAIPLRWRVANALISLGTYLRKAFCPSGFAVYYPHPGPAIDVAAVAAYAAVLFSITWCIARFGVRCKWLPVGWFWFIGVLVPVLGFVQVGGVGMADRCTYLAMPGIYMAVARGLGEARKQFRLPRVAVGISCSAMIFALAMQASIHVGYWKDSQTLFRRALDVTELNWMAHAVLGRLAQAEGRYQEAELHYREALRIVPNLPEVNNNLGEVLDSMGRSAEAVTCIQEEIKRNPGFAVAHYNLAVLLGKAGRREEAIAEYREALRLAPGYPEANNNLGVLLSEIGLDAEAVLLYRAAIEARHGYSEAHFNLGVALSRMGRLREAEEHLREAVRLNPARAEAENNLGVVLAKQRRFREALLHFREALRLRPGYESARRNFLLATRDEAEGMSAETAAER